MWRRLYTRLSEEEELRRATDMMMVAAVPPANATDVTRMASLVQVWVLDNLTSVTERHMMAKALINTLCEAVGLPKPKFP